METSATSATTASAYGPGKADKSSKALADNFDTFLKILVTQLQNQDPLKPMDSSEFTQQLVSFSGVEQAIATNKNLESLISLQSVSQASNIVGYLGNEIQAKGDQAPLKDGSATWTYDLPPNTAQTTMTVLNGTGKVVYVGVGPTTAGTRDFTWNGHDNAGNPLPDGVYTLEVAAQDTGGKTAMADTYIRGVVDGIETLNGGNMLSIGGVSVDPKDVTRIMRPAPAG